jgi:phage terminase small subunit
MKLTLKQEAFCNYYIETGNASEAYRRAYSCENMQGDTINRKAAELLQNGKITARVGELQDQLQRKSDITKEEALVELANIVRSRVTDIMNVKGTRVVVKSLSELPDNVTSSIASVKKVKGGIEIRFYDKIAAIDRLSKMLGWDKPTSLSVQGSVPVAEWLKSFSENDEK